jgi:hypothetical protein
MLLLFAQIAAQPAWAFYPYDCAELNNFIETNLSVHRAMEKRIEKQDKASLTRDLTKEDMQSRELWYQAMEDNLSKAAKWASIYNARCK